MWDERYEASSGATPEEIDGRLLVNLCRGEFSGFNMGGCIESGGTGGGGIAFDRVESGMPLFDEREERSAEAGTVG